MKRKKILLVLLILVIILAFSNYYEVQAQTQFLNLQRNTWDHSSLSVLVTIPENEPWWKPSNLNATLRAISQWNHAIQDFASNYTNYKYLSNLRMTPTTVYTKDIDFDIYLSWTETSLTTEEIGNTRTIFYVPSRISINSTIMLTSKTFQGYNLNEIDMQNVALHELGHSLGLEHSNILDDVMYPMVSLTPLTQVQELSTLDLFGIATVFQWMSNDTAPYSPQRSSIALPSNIAYQRIPISDTDLPKSQYSSFWQTLITYIQELVSQTINIISRPIVLIILIVIVPVLIIALIFRRQNSRKPKIQNLIVSISAHY